MLFENYIELIRTIMVLLIGNIIGIWIGYKYTMSLIKKETNKDK